MALTAQEIKDMANKSGYELVDAYKSGQVSRSQLDEVLGADNVSAWIQQKGGEASLGVTPRTQDISPMSADAIRKTAAGPGGGQALLDMYRSGRLTQAQIADAVGQDTVQRWLSTSGNTLNVPTTAIVTSAPSAPAMTAQQITEIGNAEGGGARLRDMFNRGEVTMDQLTGAYSPEIVQSWINNNNSSQVGASATSTTPTVPNIVGVNPPASSDVSNQTLLADAARGNVSLPGTNLTTTPIDTAGTFTNDTQVQQINPVQGAQSSTVSNAPVIQGSLIDSVSLTNSAAKIPTSLITEVAKVGQAAPAQAAVGQVSANSLAQEVAVDTTGTQAQAVKVEAPTGATVEAAVGTMPPEAIAEAAKVYGIETARIQNAKNQLRKAGLSEADIAELSNDPTALEMRLSDFTDEQRGIIGGLPEEALVSTQMEQLLAGIENGEVPLWAKPAVQSVEAMLARRGMSASTVGRDALVNAIIQASIPIAQSNAQSIQQSVLQQRGFEQQAAIREAELKTQATLQNAQNVFNLNLRNLDAEQQARVVNSQFFQTVAITEATNKQQAAIQNAVTLANLKTAELDANTRIRQSNAQAFLQMDMANLSAKQQALMVDAQFEQQRLLSDASAINAAKQFNASSENQTNQFMASLSANIEQFNVTQLNAMKQFNATEANKIAAQNAGNEVAVEQFNAQILTQVSQFNSNMELQVEQWNAANAQAVEQSNVQWRRQANTANTAAQNAINQQNVQNAFALTQGAQSALWQELRDAATFTFQGHENQEDREAQLYATAIGNEAAATHNYDHTTHLVNLAKSFFE